MSSQPGQVEEGKVNEPRRKEARRWVEKVRRPLDVRLDKVLATREALRHNRYNTEDALEETIARLSNDLWVWCGGASETDRS